MAEGKREVDELRQEIAKLDAQLLVALDKRARAARRLREVRKDQAPSLPLTDHAAIRALVARSSGDMPQDSLRDIFREIFAACLALELPVKVAYVGPEGGAGHAAVRGRFGRSSAVLAAESTAAALDEVTRKRAEYAVVPFETAAEGPGAVHHPRAHGERPAHRRGARRDVRSAPDEPHRQLRRRREDLRHRRRPRALPALPRRPDARAPSVLDVKTPLMACQLAVEDHGAAAIASETFGAQLGLEVARRNVLDARQRARPLRRGRCAPSARTGDDVTSLVFSVQDAPGSLLDVLKVFAERGINLSNIQSHPVRRRRPGSTSSTSTWPGTSPTGPSSWRSRR